MHKLVRITTVPLSLEKLLEGQLTYMNKFYEVTAISADKERLEKLGNSIGVKTFPVTLTRAITPIQDIKSLFRLYMYLKNEKPLIVHTHTPKAGVVGMLAAKLAGVPIRIHTVAGLPLMETTGAKRKLLDWVEKLTYTCAVRIYPNSFKLKSIINELGFAKESKLKVLGNGSSNGIDTKYFDPSRYSLKFKSSLRKNLGISLDDFVYIFVGRLVREKGINELVAAFSKLQEEVENISLILVGPLEQELDPLNATTIEIINKHPKIITTGFQADVRSYFAISNALTFPSYREGFPNVVMQANAMSLPAIVSNINGCNEIIQNDVNGLIIKVKDEVALKEAMKKLLENPKLCWKLTQNTRPLIQANFEREQFWKILLKEYKELEGLHKHV
ncbi:glycosyltransferase family 4 protein [Christiangramia aquimixticola]|uniref:glycosyltransferase family 4 protein n=1 Tax=Christiangramia aquimixticola TaxID=1697558 RepID=UPI003AA7AC67